MYFFFGLVICKEKKQITTVKLKTVVTSRERVSDVIREEYEEDSKILKQSLS